MNLFTHTPEVLLKSITDYFDSHNYKKDFLSSIYISNSCTPNYAVPIGLVGHQKRINGHLCDVFTLYLNGSLEKTNTHLGTPFGDIRTEHIPIVLYKLFLEKEAHASEFNSWITDNVFPISVLLSDYLV
ncbi:hypothetical protein PBV87_14980 [Niameybacter massiliensis]|uniref:Uncharacterized protein n=1 Tax=Holtiella tumoricola TaxID=3018743 RepID=A0AA42DPD6_9FIRM|nr:MULTISPECIES: hypothetical protein [Lachnospirales]MDA3732779.1 hypothetical protein [Holtiella tumoricola]